MKISSLIIALAVLTLVGCDSNNSNSEICNNESEWRDKNGPDSCSYYSENELCVRIIGKLKIKSRLHKSSLENGVFQGGMSSRWLEISKDSIKYFTPSGDLADKGKYTCTNGTLRIDWKKGDNLPEEAKIHFNSSDFVELRYYDFPFSFNSFQYDSLKGKINPTKIIGTIK
jgi:hypothetical protein